MPAQTSSGVPIKNFIAVKYMLYFSNSSMDISILYPDRTYIMCLSSPEKPRVP